jgi:hypothetical protein
MRRSRVVDFLQSIFQLFNNAGVYKVLGVFKTVSDAGDRTSADMGERKYGALQPVRLSPRYAPGKSRIFSEISNSVRGSIIPFAA